MQSQALICRAPVAEDRQAWEQLWHGYLDFYGAERGPDVFDWTWGQILSGAGDMHARLAVLDGRLVGLVHFLYHHSFWEPQKRCYLNDLFTTPEARGRGAGEALIKAVYTHAADAGAAQVYWLTAEDNAPARALYDRVAEKTPFIKYMEPK